MNRARTAVLDNEAIQALSDVCHRKHRRALAALEVVAARNLGKAGSVRLVVPTAVRVEAGWDRRRRDAGLINRFPAEDAGLDSGSADRAAGIRIALDVSVADAHIGAVIEDARRPVAVLTSDAAGLRRIAAHLGVAVNAVVV